MTDRVGRFELADGAALFLDEIANVPMSLQPKLPR
jgi:transcriptional regulator with GAF, ATPase, and Fis domain